MKSSTKHPRGAASPLVFIGLAVIVLLLSWWGTRTLSSAKTESDPAGAAPAGMPPANVILSQVEKKLSQQTQRVIGTLRAKSRSKLAAREAGAVLEILVKEGDLVTKDSIIARIDPRRLEAQIVEANATVTEARAVVTQREAEKTRASTDLKMKEELYAQRALSESEVLDARRGADVAEAMASAAAESLGAMAVFYIGFVITKPLMSMVDTVEKIRGGDLSIRAPIVKNDEIGFLARAFNSMVDRIEDTSEEMENINKSLEYRVTERTKELNASKEKAEGAADAVENAAKEAGDAAGDAVDSAKDAAGDAVDAAGDAVDSVKDAAGNAVDAAGNAVEGAKEAAGDAVEGAAEDGAKKVGDAVKNVAN